MAKIKPAVGAASDVFGRSVAAGSGRIVVGAEGDATAQGAAYIYDLNGTFVSKIIASDGVTLDRFGYSVAVGSGRIVVGAYGDGDNGFNSGSAYIFNLNGGTHLAKIKPSDGAFADNFGYSVSIGCGRIVIGASDDDDLGSQSGAAYIFDLSGTQLAKIIASDGASIDEFGTSVAVGCGRIVVGAWGDDDNGSQSGSAYIFDLNGTQLAKIKASDAAAGDYFGYSVAIASGRIVVGALFDDSSQGSAYVFNLNGTQLAKIVASDPGASNQFGGSVAIGSGRIVAGAMNEDTTAINSGAAYIYKLPETSDTYYENVLDTFRY